MGLSKGATISSRRDFCFLGCEGGFPIDASHLVEAFLLVVGLESGGNEAVGAEQAADCLPVERIVVSFPGFCWSSKHSRRIEPPRFSFSHRRG